MLEDKIAPTYDELNHALQHTEASIDAGEAHGILCGFICAGQEMDGRSWIEPILGNASGSDEVLGYAKKLLLKLYEISSIKLQQIEFDFSLLLPDDDEPLTVRMEALSHWCQGFIIALDRSGINARASISGEVQEALDHMLEISKIDYEITEPTEENERDYFEVVEYLRMTILMVHTDIASEQGGSGESGSSKGRLH